MEPERSRSNISTKVQGSREDKPQRETYDYQLPVFKFDSKGSENLQKIKSNIVHKHYFTNHHSASLFTEMTPIPVDKGFLQFLCGDLS